MENKINRQWNTSKMCVCQGWGWYLYLSTVSTGTLMYSHLLKSFYIISSVLVLVNLTDDVYL